MTARDVLAGLVHDAGCPFVGCVPRPVDYRRADAVIAAGWVPPAPVLGGLLVGTAVGSARPVHVHEWVQHTGGPLTCSGCGSVRAVW